MEIKDDHKVIYDSKPQQSVALPLKHTTCHVPRDVIRTKEKKRISTSLMLKRKGTRKIVESQKEGDREVWIVELQPFYT